MDVVGDGAEILGDWLGMLQWSHLVVFTGCAAREVGFGHEFAGSCYDDDLEPHEEPFKGVCVTGSFRDGRVVLDRGEIDLIFLDLFDFIEATAPHVWPAICLAASIVRARAGRAGPSVPGQCS